MNLVFDNTFNGLLTAVFETFERKYQKGIIIAEKYHQPSLISDDIHIITDNVKAKRVFEGLIKKISKAKADDLFRAFLSEIPKIYQIIYNLIIQIFSNNPHILDNYGDPEVLELHQTLKKVSRERHRMKAFIRFQKATDGMYIAIIEPDFNVLPLIITFLKKRYANQPWMIYDVKRKFGMLYNTHTIEEVTLIEKMNTSLPTTTIEMDEDDALYQQLWKRYFKSTNIEARKNMKLHLQHVPKRYWKYLIEKQ